MSKNSVLLVAPYRDEDAFLQRLAVDLDAELVLLNYSTTLSVSRGVIRRHMVIFQMALKAFRQRGQYDYILFGEQFVGLYYALFSRLFFWLPMTAKSMVLQLIYNRQPGLGGALYRRIYGWLAQSPALTFLVCHSSLEREYYLKEFGPALSRKLFFVPFGRGVPAPESKNAVTSEQFFFSGGTSNRDYGTLIEAFRGLPFRLVIACHAKDVAGITIPDNVTARHDLFGKAFQSAIANSLAVILPITSTEVSGGQLVLLDAMRAGKASVVTAGGCMEDYVDPSCALSVPKQDVAALRAAVLRLSGDSALCARLGVRASQRYGDEFTRAQFARRLVTVLAAQVQLSEANFVSNSAS